MRSVHTAANYGRKSATDLLCLNFDRFGCAAPFDGRHVNGHE